MRGLLNSVTFLTFWTMRYIWQSSAKTINTRDTQLFFGETQLITKPAKVETIEVYQGRQCWHWCHIAKKQPTNCPFFWNYLAIWPSIVGYPKTKDLSESITGMDSFKVSTFPRTLFHGFDGCSHHKISPSTQHIFIVSTGMRPSYRQYLMAGGFPRLNFTTQYHQPHLLTKRALEVMIHKRIPMTSLV